MTQWDFSFILTRWYPHAIRDNFKDHNSEGKKKKKKSTESSTMQKEI